MMLLASKRHQSQKGSKLVLLQLSAHSSKGSKAAGLGARGSSCLNSPVSSPPAPPPLAAGPALARVASPLLSGAPALASHHHPALCACRNTNVKQGAEWRPCVGRPACALQFPQCAAPAPAPKLSCLWETHTTYSAQLARICSYRGSSPVPTRVDEFANLELF
eukprot:1154186-Pelagomonas_calceolata.AAC.1